MPVAPHGAEIMRIIGGGLGPVSSPFFGVTALDGRHVMRAVATAPHRVTIAINTNGHKLLFATATFTFYTCAIFLRAIVT